MNYLPKEILHLTFLYLPYDQVNMIEDRAFWLLKTGMEMRKNWQDQEFKDFFDHSPLTLPQKYLRYLAYHGIAYPGSEIILSRCEMFRHGLKDPELMDLN